MIPEPQKTKLNNFLEAVNLVSHSAGGEEIFDLGLIIIEKDSSIEVKDIAKHITNQTKKIKTDVLEYNNETFWENFIEKIVNALEAEKWILLNIKTDPGHDLINLLKNLSDKNLIQLTDFRDKEIFNLKLPLKSRVICVLERNFLEKNISYPYFLNIFGPVISL